MAPRQVTAFSENEINSAFRRSVATMSDAVEATEAAITAWGARAYLDPWCRPGDRVVYLRDAARPEWLIAQPVLCLEIGFERPEPVFDKADWPPELRKLMRKKTPTQAVSHDPRPGVFTVQEGRRSLQVTINKRGFAYEWMRSCGDAWDVPVTSSLGFAFDPDLLVHLQPQPLSLACRPDLDPDGLPPRLFGQKIADCDNGNEERVRVWLPAPVPGGPQITKRRALNALKALSWDGRLDDPGEGWLVVDGFDHTAIASGDTLEEAFEAWKLEVARVRPRVPPDQIPTAEQRAQIREIRAAREAAAAEPPEPMASETSVGPDGKTLQIRMQMNMVFIPPRDMDWPAECPAVALPLPPRPAIPDRLAALGFSRTVRLFGEHGQVAHGFVREDRAGHLFVGEDAVDAVNPRTFEADLDAADVAGRGDAPAGSSADPYRRHPEYPVRTRAYTVLHVNNKETTAPRSAGVSHHGSFSPTGFEDAQRWSIFRTDRAG